MHWAHLNLQSYTRPEPCLTWLWRSRAVLGVLAFTSLHHSIAAREWLTAHARLGEEHKQHLLPCCEFNQIILFKHLTFYQQLLSTQQKLRRNCRLALAPKHLDCFYNSKWKTSVKHSIKPPLPGPSSHLSIYQPLLTGPPYKMGRLLWCWLHLFILFRGVLSLCYSM